MLKPRRPELATSIQSLADCPACHGAGLEQGLFGKRVCGTCFGVGLLGADGEPLLLEQALLQLRLRLTQAQGEVRQLRARLPAPEPTYYTDNRRGAGGSHFTGD